LTNLTNIVFVRSALLHWSSPLDHTGWKAVN